MSRFTLRSDADYEVVVGWDDPLGTFFAQVYDVREGQRQHEDVLVVWAGTSPGEITELRALEDKVRGFASIPTEVSLVLGRQQANRREPTAFQRDVFNKITGDELP